MLRAVHVCAAASAPALAVRFTAKLDNVGTDSSDDSGEFQEAFGDQIAVQVKAAAANSAGSGDIKFDEQFFRDNCDLSEFGTDRFDSPKFQLDANVALDDQKWKVGHSCKKSGFGKQTFVQDNFVGTKNQCATWCSQKSDTLKGQIICCELWEQEKICKANVGWQDLVVDRYGTSYFNPMTWVGLRKPKRARFLYTAPTAGATDSAPTDQGEEMKEADEDQQFIQQLVGEVNHMSIDGILNHLLSFYVCMRWIPDAEFVKLASFELQTVSVDEKTPRIPAADVNRDKVLDMYIDQSITPLRCNNNMHVQSVSDINKLIADLENPGSNLNYLYKYTTQVDSNWRRWWWFGKRRNLNEGMKWNASKPNEDSVFVADVRQKARDKTVLPWSTFVRSSQMFERQGFDDDQRFMICFGPRVSSNPHKREGGGHVLTDTNMAGCNGYWSKTVMIDHINRIKRLFSPELCFEDKLRKELKTQFLNTFVRMNQEFEQAMFGKFTKRLHALDPTQSKKLTLLTDRNVNITDTLNEKEQKIFTKFKRTAGLVAKAHSKWVICEAKDTVTKEPFGTEDNFFRDPKSYQRWLGKVFDDTVPECRTYDPTTGCVKCAIAVKNMHDCHIRLNVSMASLFTALKEKKWPFLMSNYKVKREKITDLGPRIVEDTVSAACLVRKSSTTAQKAAEAGDLAAIKSAFFQVNDTDGVVRLNFTAKGALAERIVSTYHYEIKDRRKKLADYIDNGGATTDATDDLINALQEETYRDLNSRWAERFVFTDRIGALNNVPEHKVDYFMSCPCSKVDFKPTTFFTEYPSQGMDQYING